MPAQYEAIRDKMIAQGMAIAQAKKHAAMIYNAHRGNKPPVTGKDKK